MMEEVLEVLLEMAASFQTILNQLIADGRSDRFSSWWKCHVDTCGEQQQIAGCAAALWKS